MITKTYRWKVLTNKGHLKEYEDYDAYGDYQIINNSEDFQTEKEAMQALIDAKKRFTIKVDLVLVEIYR